MNVQQKMNDDEREPVLNILMVLIMGQASMVAIGTSSEAQATHLVLPTSTMVRL